MLWLGLLGRDTGTPASQHLGIKDEVLALGFNLAVSLRLSLYDNKQQENQAKLVAYEVAKWWSGSPDDSDNILESKYIDANTEIW